MSGDRREVGNGYWIVKWLVGSLWGVLIISITMLANNVIANDKKNNSTHEDIRKEMKFEDDKIKDKIDLIHNKLVDDIKKIRVDQTTMLVQQTKILTILENDNE